MSGTRNRTAGFNWEREGVKDFARYYPEVQTSRNVSRVRDAEKVDLAYPDEIRLGRFPYNAQYKTYTTTIKYPGLLAEMPQGSGAINVILHKQTKKSGTKFMPTGKYALLCAEDFFKLVQWRRGYEILKSIIDKHPLGISLEEEISYQLNEIGL